MALEGNFEISGNRIAELDTQCKKLNLQNINLKAEVMVVKCKQEKATKKYVKVKDKYEELKKNCNSEKWECREEVEKIKEKYRQLEVEKKKLEIDLKEAEKRVTNVSVEVADISLMASVEHYKSLSEESERPIITLLAKNGALENNIHVEKDFEAQVAVEAEKRRMEEEKTLELAEKIKVLEREKGVMEAEFFNVSKDFETGKRIRKEAVKKIFELQTKIGVLERASQAEKKAMEDEGKKKVSELNHRIEVLEREKSEMEAKFCLINREKIGELKKNMSKDNVLERIKVLERVNKELEAKVGQAMREKSEEIKRILIEKTDLKEMYSKRILEVIASSGILERKIRELEAENREKDERMKVLVQENERLAAKRKKTENKINYGVLKSAEDVDLPQRVHPARNVGISSTPLAPSQAVGTDSGNTTVTEPMESSNGGMQFKMFHSEIRKRKVEGLESSVANQAEIKRGKLDGVTELKSALKSRRDMYNALTVNDELCLLSICALYRKYKSPGTSDSPSCYERRGMALGELLTGRDPEGRLKKSLAEFEQEDSSGLADCRRIACQHYKELFEIYKNNLDPLFYAR